MDMKKYCHELRSLDPPLSDIPVVYLPCPHKIFKSKVINRITLTHEQHTELLATPKGFSWDKNTGLATSKRKKKRKNVFAVKAPLCKTDYRYVRDFITDVWNVMIPKYEKQLEEILVLEFGMSESKAKELIEEQRLRNAFTLRKPFSKVNLSPRHDWIRDMADVLSGKLTDYLIGMLNSRRTKKVRFVAEAILKGFGDLTGEKCSLDDPQNRVQDVQVFAADRLAVWLSNILGDYDEELCREMLKDRGEGLGDTDESSEDEEGPQPAKEDPPKEEAVAPEEVPAGEPPVEGAEGESKPPEEAAPPTEPPAEEPAADPGEGATA